LPEPLAIELPAGVTELAPDAPPLRNLLAAATSDARVVTYVLDRPAVVGPVRVTWTAWDGAPAVSNPVATATAVLFVLPTGISPVGLSGDENATGGNNAARIARNARGDIAHMVWVDGGRAGKGSRVLYRRGSIAPDGSLTWQIAPERVDDDASEAGNSYPALAVSGDRVHVAWQAKERAWYRRLDPVDGTFKWSAKRDLEAASDGPDVGPSIDAVDQFVHVATPSGFDIFSSDGGTAWRAEAIPLPAGRRVKTISVALDPSGVAHFAGSVVVRDPKNASTERASGGYWELLYLRRGRDGVWTPAQNALRGRPEWAEPVNDDDVLADWVRIVADEERNLHITWHGTAKDRIYGNDIGYYAFCAASGGGWCDSWGSPQMVLPPDPTHNHSFAPTLALDRSVALPLTFYDVFDGPRWIGFDTVGRVARRGVLDSARIPVSQWVRKSIDTRRPEAALSARFPSSAVRVYRAPDGRAWLDGLETLIPEGVPDSSNLIVYQRFDLTPWLGNARIDKRPEVAAPQVATAELPEFTVLFTMRDIIASVQKLFDRVRP
jgi:hypothetical protein